MTVDMQKKLRRFGGFFIVLMFCVFLAFPLGILAFVFLPIFLVISLPLGVLFVISKAGSINLASNYSISIEPLSDKTSPSSPTYRLIHPKLLVSDYKSFHLN